CPRPPRSFQPTAPLAARAVAFRPRRLRCRARARCPARSAPLPPTPASPAAHATVCSTPARPVLILDQKIPTRRLAARHVVSRPCRVCARVRAAGIARSALPATRSRAARSARNRVRRARASRINFGIRNSHDPPCRPTRPVRRVPGRCPVRPHSF
ncbi:hypothetical protein EXIGLDRAFT_841953, partial [Exidia glandulosa HHB12029]